ncbi:MAG: radical SAM protein [Spirochaetales bacterium]|nr:radical SAM protein [Spirochaetales bacterium]
MIKYDEPLFRPPSEAESLIIQATLGCSHNQCTFCSMYKTKSYVERSFEDISADIESMASFSEVRRVFIADGDAMELDTSLLLKIIKKLKVTFPHLRRISIYANSGNILKKTDEELQSLKAGGLSLIYLGFESGSDFILKKVRKGASSEDHRMAVLRVMAAGIDVSATIVTGLGGKENWEEHIRESAELVNKTVPKFLSTLSLMITSDCRERFLSAFENGLTLRDDRGMLEEERLLISLIDTPKNIIFRSNHASNALALRGELPRDRSLLIEQIDQALNGDGKMRPDWMRGF